MAKSVIIGQGARRAVLELPADVGDVEAHLSASAPHSGHEATARKDVANGYAGLDANARISSSTLPALVYARASRATAQSIPYGSDNIIDFSTVDDDPFGAVTTGANWKFTVPSGQGGLYQVGAYVEVDVGGTATVWALVRLRVYVNGSASKVLDRLHIDTADGNFGQQGVGGTTLLRLNAGDYVDFRVHQQNDDNSARNTVADVNAVHCFILRVPGAA